MTFLKIVCKFEASEVFYYIVVIRIIKETARARISNHLSGGQSHLIHLTVLRRFSWSILAYNYVHKGGLKTPIHFISLTNGANGENRDNNRVKHVN